MDFYEQKTIAEAVDILKCDIDQGLSADEADSRVGFSGPNEIHPKKETPVSSKIYERVFRPFTLAMLLAAAALGVCSEYFAAGLLLLANSLEIFLSLRAERKNRSALDTFGELARERVKVRREGEVIELAVSELAHGDIVLLQPSQTVPADMRLIKSSSLFIDESPLTGRPVLGSKDAMFIASEPLPFSKRRNMAYMGSRVVVGEGEGVVTATGRNTEMGQAAYLFEDQRRPDSPLEAMLVKLSPILAIFAGASALLVTAGALLRGFTLPASLGYALSGLISAYPVGIGFVVISALALGASGIARAGIILNRSASIPSLGELTALCVDKTGIFTDNRVSVGHLYYNGSFFPKEGITFADCGPLITGFALCSSLEDDTGHSDQGRFESALLELTEAAGMSPARIATVFPRISALPYKHGHEMSTSLHEGPGGETVSFTMGPPEDIISRSVDILKDGQIRPITDEDIVDIEAAVQRLAMQGLDVITLCTRRGDSRPTEDNLIFVGLAGLSDPLCAEADQMLDTLRQSGIRVILLSEESPDRAAISAEMLGIISDDDELDQHLSAGDLEQLSDDQLAGLSREVGLYSEVTPLAKLRIVNALKEAGEIVGITGRGIWDCPAIVASNLGIAISDGSLTVRRAADIVIREKGLISLARAANRARAAFENAKTSLRYLLTANIALTVSLIWAAFSGNQPPLTPFGILWLNLAALLLPAASFGSQPLFTPGGGRPKSRPSGLLNSNFLLSSVIYGLFIGFGTLLAYSMGLKISESELLEGAEALAAPRAFAFCTLSFSMLLHIPGAIAGERSVFTVNPLSNRLALLAFFAGSAAQAAIGALPVLAEFFGMRTLAPSEWAMALTISLIPLILHELVFFVTRMVNRLGR